jgi:hypothetical protein
MEYYYPQPVRQVLLPNAPREVGALTHKDNRTYEVIRVEQNGLCFGVRTDDLENQRRGFREWTDGKNWQK